MTKRMFSSLILFMLAIGFFMQGVSAVAPEDAPPLLIPSPAGGIAPSDTVTETGAFENLTASIPFPVWTLIGIILIIIGVAGFLLLRRPARYTPKSKRLLK